MALRLPKGKKPKLAPHNLEEVALGVSADLQRRIYGGDGTEAVLAWLEEKASREIADFVDEFPECCNPGEARAWTKTPRALDKARGLYLGDDPKLRAVGDILLSAAGVLLHTEECRNEIEAGNAEAASLAMHRATYYQHRIELHVEPSLDPDFISWIEGKERGRETTRKNKATRNSHWVGEARRGMLRNQKKTTITSEIGVSEKPPVDRTTVSKKLKDLMGDEWVNYKPSRER